MIYTLLQLNTWCGRAPHFLELFYELILGEKPDIICLQEVCEAMTGDLELRSKVGSLSNLLSILHKRYWNEYEFYVSPKQSTWIKGGLFSDTDSVEHYGNVMMWRRTSFTMTEARTKFIFAGHDTFDHVNDYTVPPVMQSLVLESKTSGKKILAINVHGWFAGKGVGKADRPERFEQSNTIVEFMRSHGEKLPVVLSGDFNIRVDSESLGIIENYLGPNCNAIKEFGIELTRTPLYDEPKRTDEPHASYVLARGMRQISCMADSESLISDHAPIIFKFEIQ